MSTANTGISSMRSRSRASRATHASVDMEAFRRALHNSPMPVASSTPASALRDLNQEVGRRTKGTQPSKPRAPKPLVVQELEELDQTVPSLQKGLAGASRMHASTNTVAQRVVTHVVAWRSRYHHRTAKSVSYGTQSFDHGAYSAVDLVTIHAVGQCSRH